MPPETPPPVPSWARSDRPVPRLVVRPLREFLDTEVAGGIVLLAATTLALISANSPWSASYGSLWQTELVVRLGGLSLELDLRHWINDGLMTLFFFVMALEIKRELVEGVLSDRKRAALPVIAAAGGMLAPAAIYAALNANGAEAGGWGVPIATDIAFALGVVALVGPRVPASLRVFLLTLAIADDVGAIIAIALFYADDIDVAALALALTVLGGIILLRSVHVWWVPLYVVAGTIVWLATLVSGVHATIAGVALGLLAPAHPLDRTALKRVGLGIARLEERPSPEEASAARRGVIASLSVAERLAHVLHPWTSFVILPLFALANAGISLSSGDLRSALGSRVTLGVLLGLVVGKAVGITGAAWLAQRTRIAELPDGVNWIHMAGIGTVAGIGFTVSIFVASLAFEREALVQQAKVGILAASLVASLLGALLLLLGRERHRHAQG
jgi:NhaA family Na+:H+ antiporter